jgi:hypothetical protein
MMDIAVCHNPGAGLPDQTVCGRSKRSYSLASGSEFNNYLGHLLNHIERRELRDGCDDVLA